MEPGTRVIYSTGISAKLGVVVANSKAMTSVEFDGPAGLLSVPTDKLKAIDFWREVPKTIKNPEVLDKYLTDVLPLALFKRNKTVVVTMPLLKAMWHWSNKHVYDSHLKPIEFKIQDSGRLYGLYLWSPKDNIRYIRMSQMNNTYLLLFSTVVHEMIHQHNYEWDVPKGIFTYQQVNNHGVGFHKVAEEVKAKIGVKITVIGNGDTEVDGESALKQKIDITADKLVAPYVVLVCKRDIDGAYFGFRAKNLVEAHSTAGVMKTLFPTSRIYAGLTRLSRPVQYLNTINLKSYKGTRKEIISMLKSNCQNLEDFYGLDMMD